ncbi:MAG: glycosyl hydrolase, partial [Victivallaceae bacterium]|nr:glycosyl hydrolase [Victivallaceae bacterium]
MADFSAPAPQFRGAPFWAWNGKLDQNTVRKQVRELQQLGFGGFFIHSRVGLATEYLGDEWFQCVRAAVEEAGKLHMSCWIYDDDRWPSGTAGGLVTRNDQHVGKHLDFSFEHTAAPQEGESPLSEWFVRFEGEIPVAYRKKDAGDSTLPQPGEKIMHVFLRLSPKSGAFNQSRYLDVLDPEAVGTFVKITHERYQKELPEGALGGVVPGFFTDEPTFFLLQAKYPWTARLPEQFHQRYGYDLCAVLPELLLCMNGVEHSRVRLHYYDLLADLMAESYAGTITKWCEEHHVFSTGHVLFEEDALSQAVTVGSAMRFYEKMSGPGMDVLTGHWNLFDAAKQVSSVARQFGKEIRLSECCGASGWEFPLTGFKMVGDWQAALGINFRCIHHAWYSMKGDAKRDYPPFLFTQLPYRQAYSHLEDYF